jgi:hypothetical protein
MHAMFAPISGKYLRIAIAVIVVAQLAAIFVLCRMQVRRAEARVAIVQVHRTALDDCMQTMPRATLNRCSAPIAR